MPLNLPTFRKLTPEDFGTTQYDIIGALGKGQNLLGQQQQYEQAKQLFPGELQKQQLANQIAQIQAKYAEPTAQQELRKAQLFNQYYGPNIQSEIAQRQATTQGKNIENQFSPEKLRLANELAKLKAQYYPQLTEAQIDAQKALANYRKTGGTGALGTGGKDLQDMAKQIQLDNPNFTPEQVNDARNAYLEGRETLSDGSPLPPLSGAMKTLLQSSYKRSTDVAQRNQERFADTLETAIKSADENVKVVTEYSGLLGKSQGSAERATSLLGGKSSKKLQALNNFINVDVPTMAGEYMRQLGVNASDEQKRMYKAVVNPITWYNDPATALSQWEYFKKLAKNVGATISKPAYQRNIELNKKVKDVLSSNKNEDKKSSNSEAIRFKRDESGKLIRY